MARARWLLLLPLIGFVLSWIPLATVPPVYVAPWDYFFDGTTGIIIATAGVVAWNRQPANPTGRILVLAGYLWYVGSLEFGLFDASIIGYFSWIFRGFYDPLLAFVVLSFPRARIETRWDAAALLSVVGSLVARAGWRLVSSQPGIGVAPAAPGNPFTLVHDPATIFNVDAFTYLALGLALLFVAAMTARRWGNLRVGSRWVIQPVLVGGILWAGLSAAYAIDEWAHWWFRADVLPWDGPGWTVSYAFRMLAPTGILIGAWRLRSGASAVVNLVASPAARSGEDLQRALRRALGDPGLELFYPRASGGWADLDGRTRELPSPESGRRATVMATADGPTGAIVHDAVLLEDPALTATVASVVRLAMDNERLRSELTAQLDEVRASRARVVEAADAERRRVERDLHDGAQQRLVALAVSLRTIRLRIGASLTPDVAAELDAASEEVRAAIAEVRELASGLDPAILRSVGLGAALESLAERSPVPVRLEVDLGGRLPQRTETTAYFVTAEALANVAKHSQAAAVLVSASLTGGNLRLEIADDGTGGADPTGRGLRGLADRVAAIDGTFDIFTSATKGTRLVATIPCA